MTRSVTTVPGRPMSALAAFGALVAVQAPCFLPSVLASERGYTWSLLVFAVPVVLGVVAVRHLDPIGWPERWRRLAWALAFLVPMVWALDLVFAGRFFVFPDPTAVLGLTLPDIAGRAVPIEEYAFYLTGFAYMALIYEGFAAVTDRGERPEPLGSGAWAAVPLGLGLALTASGRGPYLAWILVAPATVATWSAARAGGGLRGQALGWTVLAMILVSFTWEAVLGLPRGWWGYNPAALVGLGIGPLPLEAVVVWILAPILMAFGIEAMRARAAMASSG